MGPGSTYGPRARGLASLGSGPLASSMAPRRLSTRLRKPGLALASILTALVVAEAGYRKGND